jgi:Zn-dependent peptidase ImmA (M78 family)
LTLSRVELADIGSPARLAARIHELAPDLPLAFSIEALSRQLDIESIEEEAVSSFAAMLLMHPDKAWGSIVIADGTPPRRRRFSIGHELGHFLIPSHKPGAGQGFTCSQADLRSADTREKDRHKKMEAEANLFAARLLMPPSRIRANLRRAQPDLAEIVRLADMFEVSKAAMARGYVDAHRETLALVVLRDGRIEQVHRPDDFPWIAPGIGSPVPHDSIASARTGSTGDITLMDECDPEIWLSASASRRTEVLREQVFTQQGGFAMVLLHAELDED